MSINKKEKERIYQVHDKSIRKILLNKKEAVIFINQALRLENTKNEIKEEEIELYNNQYVTKIYNNRISDIVYKIKNKNVYTKNIKKRTLIKWGQKNGRKWTRRIK